MGWVRKHVKKLGRSIKKIGKKIGRAFKSILKPFAKVFGKLGPIGSIAMMMIMPGIGQMMAGWGGQMGGLVGNVIKHVGNAVNFVATAPQKIFQTITGGMRAGWNAITNATTAEGKTWFQSFGDEFNKSWKDLGYDTVWKSKGGNFWDVSEQGQARIKNFRADVGQMGKDIKSVFKPDNRTPIGEGQVDKVLETTDPSILERDFKVVPDGAVAKFRQGAGETMTKIKDVTVPGVGDVGDLAWGGSTAIGAYQAYSTFNPPEFEGSLGGSGLGALAEEQLYSSQDRGGLYNTSAPTWSYDFNLSLAQNQNNAMNSWNTNYNLPQGFDPMATPGYGFNYEQWLQQQLAA